MYNIHKYSNTYINKFAITYGRIVNILSFLNSDCTYKKSEKL